MSNPDTGETPLMSYASHVEMGTGRTPVGIIMFAASHLLLGGVLMLSAFAIFQHVRRGPVNEDWIVLPVLFLLAAPMVTGGLALLLKGAIAWFAAVVSFALLAALEAGTFAYAVGMTVRYAARGNPDVQWALVFAAMTFAIGTLCIVVVGYLAGQKARNTFGLPPGESPAFVRRLRALALVLFAVALGIGPLLRNVRALYPD